MKRSLFVASLSAVVSLFAACGPAGAPDAGSEVDTTCAASPAAVTMQTLHAEVLSTKCATCHYPAMGGMLAGSGFTYGDYSTPAAAQAAMVNKDSFYKGTPGTLKIVDQMAATTAAKLANSSLWLKVSTMKTLGHRGPKGESTGGRMPEGAPSVPADVQKIKDWICRGSPEN